MMIDGYGYPRNRMRLLGVWIRARKGPLVGL